MTERRPTLNDVAERAGVSRSTTSRVLNDHPAVRPEVRERVREAMADLGYVPDGAARSLRGGPSNVIGLVIPRPAAEAFADAYVSRLVVAVVEAAGMRDRTVAVVLEGGDETTRGLPSPADRVAGAVLPERLTAGTLLDGVIITASYRDDPLPTALHDAGLSVVVVGEPRDPRLSAVDVENARGGRLGVEHLWDAGRRRIGIVSGPRFNDSAIDRAAGAREALADLGATPAFDVEAKNFTSDDGHAAVADALIDADVDGVVAGSDSIAAGVLEALRDAGLGVPDEVGVVGFDDLSPSAITSPSLTTVRQPIERVADTATRILLDLISERPAVPVRETLPVELVVRGSSTGA